jgi:hypothetical protein
MRNTMEALNSPNAAYGPKEETKMKPLECQIPCLPLISEGYAKMGSQPLRIRLKLAVTRHLSPSMKRRIKTNLGQLVNWFSGLAGRRARSPAPMTSTDTTSFKAGDMVRVRSKEEIQATLNRWGELKGCSFMPEMWPYCSTTQRVLKPMERFLDERDYRVKKSKGIVLLEGAICQGTTNFGRCDRSCFFFWREEWLEKLDGVGEG